MDRKSLVGCLAAFLGDGSLRVLWHRLGGFPLGWSLLGGPLLGLGGSVVLLVFFLLVFIEVYFLIDLLLLFLLRFLALDYLLLFRLFALLLGNRSGLLVIVRLVGLVLILKSGLGLTAALLPHLSDQGRKFCCFELGILELDVIEDFCAVEEERSERLFDCDGV